MDVEVEDARLNYLTEQREFDSIDDEADLDLGDKGATRLFALPTSYPCSLLDNHGPGMDLRVVPKRFFDHRALFLFSLRFDVPSRVYPLNDGSDQSCLEVDDAFARRCQALKTKTKANFGLRISLRTFEHSKFHIETSGSGKQISLFSS